jgi:DnaK suppressor protein
MMNQDLSTVLAKLIQVREELLHRQGDHREGEGELLGTRESDPVDAAQAEGSAIPLDSLGENERHQLEEIEDAIARVRSGEYGGCDECEEPIEPGRLEAVPWARRCFGCATEFEKEHRGVNVF